jgi:ParB-like chromosome segregation protein Spo0J
MMMMTKKSNNNGRIPKLEKELNNRIVGHEMVQLDQLLAHPNNWRLHPKYQQDALAGLIDDIGFIRSVLVNKTTGTVIDGHLRVALASRSGVQELPVEYVELTEEQEIKALALLDPIAGMA